MTVRPPHGTCCSRQSAGRGGWRTTSSWPSALPVSEGKLDCATGTAYLADRAALWVFSAPRGKHKWAEPVRRKKGL